ncbi:hypothetical protein ACLB1E_35315 [Escherichia coli]
MSLRTPDLLFTAIAPAIWGSTYIVTTQYLPNFSPMTVAMLRALPAGLLLVMIVRQIPTGIWWMRIFILGALNISRHPGACRLFRSTACRAGSRRR